MRATFCGLAVALAATIVSCGKDVPLRPSASGESHIVHRFAGGVLSNNDNREVPESMGGNPTAPGLVRLARIGNPIWKPVDFHLFSGTVGTAANGYADFLTTALALLPPPNHVFNPSLAVGPGAPHAPPYVTELGSGVAILGFSERHTFSVGEFSNGNGVYCVWMNVPDPGASGSSPDFASGPIIPNSLFPLHVAGTTFRNGQVWDPFLGTFDVPALDAISPPFGVDGNSHFPIFYFDNMDFAPPNTNATGAYTYRIKMTDTSGSGWDIAAAFVVANNAGGGPGKMPE